MAKTLDLYLKIWRQKNSEDNGRFVDYEVKGVDENASFLEMLDILNEQLEEKGEEPVAFDNYVGLADVRAMSPIPIQGGENHWGPGDMARAIEARALDLVMIDAMKIGGITGWIEASSLARAAGWPVSSHLFPEASAHLLCADPGAHWLEWVEAGRTKEAVA